MVSRPDERSLESGICLSLIALGVDHGYAIARNFEPGRPIGDVYSLTRPAVYRELGLLETRGFVTASRDVGERGQAKKVLRLTKRGAAAAEAWIETPVEHLRDMRLDFLAKCILREMHGRPVGPFAAAQRAGFSSLFSTLESDRDSSVTARWRREQVRAVSRFLDECEGVDQPVRDAEPVDESMVLSARNQLTGTVVSVRHGSILSSVKIAIDPGQVLTSTITREATDQLRLSSGAGATAIFKATDVMMAVQQPRPSRRGR